MSGDGLHVEFHKLFLYILVLKFFFVLKIKAETVVSDGHVEVSCSLFWFGEATRIEFHENMKSETPGFYGYFHVP